LGESIAGPHLGADMLASFKAALAAADPSNTAGQNRLQQSVLDRPTARALRMREMEEQESRDELWRKRYEDVAMSIEGNSDGTPRDMPQEDDQQHV